MPMIELSAHDVPHVDAVAPKEYGILFSPPMVEAIQRDLKLVTRRLDLTWLKVKKGDRLWIREAWRTGKKLDAFNATEIAKRCIEVGYGKPGAPILYKDGSVRSWGDNDREDFGDWGRYRHARLMPRWASRITLEVTEDARLENLADITEEEAIAEGITDEAAMEFADDGSPDYVAAFMDLWDSLHTKPGERWADNPQVVRVGFRRISG